MKSGSKTPQLILPSLSVKIAKQNIFEKVDKGQWLTDLLTDPTIRPGSDEILPNVVLPKILKEKGKMCCSIKLVENEDI